MSPLCLFHNINLRNFVEKREFEHGEAIAASVDFEQADLVYKTRSVRDDKNFNHRIISSSDTKEMAKLAVRYYVVKGTPISFAVCCNSKGTTWSFTINYRSRGGLFGHALIPVGSERTKGHRYLELNQYHSTTRVLYVLGMVPL